MNADGDVHIGLVSWASLASTTATTSATAINHLPARLRNMPHYTANSLLTFLGATSRAAIVFRVSINSHCDACLHRCPREAGMGPCKATVDDHKAWCARY